MTDGPGLCSACGAGLRPDGHFCEACGHPVPAGPPSTPPPPRPPNAPAPPARTDEGRRRTVVVVVSIAAAVALVAAVLVARGDDKSSEKKPTAGEVFLEPIAAKTPDPFTADVATSERAVTTTTATSASPSTTSAASTTTTATPVRGQVVGSQPGLYGGTRNEASCDPERLIDFLGANRPKAKVWGGVLGITPADIPSYVRSLTPVVLTRDTRVRNHGYRNGRATARVAVLQAGTAVLVDANGVPRVKCGCGNPLTDAPTTRSPAIYTGARWPGFSPTTVIVIVTGPPVGQFVLVDVDTGRPFTRKVRTTGSDDAVIAADQLCDLLPSDPSCGAGASSTSTTTTPTTAPPGGEPEKIAEVANISGVQSGPTAKSGFNLDRATTIVKVTTYHWNSGQGASPGTIGIRASDGTTYGPWQARGLEGQGGVPDATWETTMQETLPPGAYEVVDSDPSTWAQNAQSGGQGFFVVFGYSAGPPTGPEGDDRATELVRRLLDGCGLAERGIQAEGPGRPAGSTLVAVELDTGTARFLVTPSTGDVVAQDPLAGEVAGDCGFSGG